MENKMNDNRVPRERVAILIDSGCDVTEELIRQYNMKLLRLHVIYPEKDYSDDLDISPQTVYERFPGEIPHTSTPSPQEVKDMADELKRGRLHPCAGLCHFKRPERNVQYHVQRSE